MCVATYGFARARLGDPPPHRLDPSLERREGTANPPAAPPAPAAPGLETCPMLELSACRAPGPPQPRARAPRQVGSGSRGAGAGHPQPCFPAQGDPARHRSPTLPLRLRCPPPSPSHGWARHENRPRGGRRPGTQPQELPASVSLSASSSCEEGGGGSSGCRCRTPADGLCGLQTGLSAPRGHTSCQSRTRGPRGRRAPGGGLRSLLSS